MKGNKLIKRIKALQKAAGHDIEIGFQGSVGSAGYRDIMIQSRTTSRNGVTIPFAAIILAGSRYYSAVDFIRIALNNRYDILGNPRCSITAAEKMFMSAILE